MSERFYPGQCVRLSALGVERGMQGRAKHPLGYVVRTDASIPTLIWVRRFGQKTVSPYHTDFWEASHA